MDFTFPFFFLSTLSALNDFLHNYDFVILIMRDFGTTKGVVLVHDTRFNDARFMHKLCKHAYFI